MALVFSPGMKRIENHVNHNIENILSTLNQVMFSGKPMWPINNIWKRWSPRLWDLGKRLSFNEKPADFSADAPFILAGPKDTPMAESQILAQLLAVVAGLNS